MKNNTVDKESKHVGKFMTILQRDSMTKIDSAENLCKPDQEQIHQTSRDNEKRVSTKPSVWNRNHVGRCMIKNDPNDSADFGSFQNTNENLSDEEIVSFDNLRKHMKKRNEAEETLGAVNITSNSQIQGKTLAVRDSSQSLQKLQSRAQEIKVEPSQQSECAEIAKACNFVSQEDELPVFGH